MELRETIENINKKLKEEFGYELDGRPRFRVVFSDDQFEKRWIQFTDEGFPLLEPEVRELPKYRQFIQQKYILERLVPVVGETDLIEKMSYEPCWVFQTKNQEYLPPFYDGCLLVIRSMYDAMGKAGTFTKYKDKNVSKEEQLAHIERVEKELFGNETEMADNLHIGAGITVPEMPSKLIH
jgi:hypothetical protein